MKNNKKGFTLAELLIVVAIIGVLVAISIPVFTTQLKKSQLATDTANVRSVYAEEVAEGLASGDAITIQLAKLSAAAQYSTVSVSSDTVTVTHKTNTSLKNEFKYDSDVTITIN